MAQVVEGNLLGQHLAKDRALRTRPNKAHLTSKNIEKLRELIQTVFSYKAANLGYPIVESSRPDRTICLGVFIHRTKLKDFDRVSLHARSLLTEENRPSSLEQNRYRD